MTVFQFVICALACYRCTVLIARDACPWRICARLRKVRGLSNLLKCPYCVSLWCAALIVTAFYACQSWKIGDNPAMPALTVLALSAVAIMLDRTFSDGYVAD